MAGNDEKKKTAKKRRTHLTEVQRQGRNLITKERRARKHLARLARVIRRGGTDAIGACHEFLLTYRRAAGVFSRQTIARFGPFVALASEVETEAN